MSASFEASQGGGRCSFQAWALPAAPVRTSNGGHVVCASRLMEPPDSPPPSSRKRPACDLGFNAGHHEEQRAQYVWASSQAAARPSPHCRLVVARGLDGMLPATRLRIGVATSFKLFKKYRGLSFVS